MRPVSYGITLESSDHYRETESPRLRHRAPGEAPPPTEQPAAGEQTGAAPATEAAEADNEDEFGSFSQAVATPVESTGHEPAITEQPVKTQVTPATATAAEQAQTAEQRQADEDTDWRYTKWRPHTVKAAFSNPQLQTRQWPPPEGVKPHTVKAAFRPPPASVDSDDEGDFGEFSGADTLPSGGPQEGEQKSRFILLAIIE